MSSADNIIPKQQRKKPLKIIANLTQSTVNKVAGYQDNTLKSRDFININNN